MEINNYNVASVTYVQKVPTSQVAAKQQTLAHAEVIADPFSEIAAKYDMTDISPREIDKLAAELQQKDMIEDGDWLMMLTKGAEFLSNLSGSHYTEDRLNSKTNVIARLEEQIDTAKRTGSSPTESMESLLDVFRELDIRKDLPKEGLLV